MQVSERLEAGPKWIETGALCSHQGRDDDGRGERPSKLASRIGAVLWINAEDWTPRELRHSFVSMLSDMGLEVDKIAQLVGHTGGSTVTEVVYRHQLRPVLQTGALALDQRFRPRADELCRTVCRTLLELLANPPQL